MSDFQNANLLAIDTATATLRLAVGFGGDRVIKTAQDVQRSHGLVLLKMIDDILKSAEIPREKLQGLVVGTGPGSFTGLRIGLAAAKGIAVALDIPVVGLSLFDLAAALLPPEQVQLVVPFKRDQVFVGPVENGQWSAATIQPVSLSELSDRLIDRTAVGICLNVSDFVPGVATPRIGGRIEYDSADLLRLGRERLSAGSGDDLAGLEPLYLQRSQAEIRFDQGHQDI
ncbi:MAG: tRNA (adenosine(37)-N6)-threonylcarbamoyltransferase complex dimerization subunit type 1 TsaB [bacterium]